MELGEKIRQARLEAGLSQRQLCGETITRNMLSLIESGKARPGMDTLLVLAKRLDKPVGWFLEQEAVTSPNQAVMVSARAAFDRKDWEGVKKLLQTYRGPDALFDRERYLLECICLLSLAEQSLDKPPYAKSLLEAAADMGRRTPYYTAALQRRRALLLAQVAPEQAASLVGQLPGMEQELLLRAKVALDQADPARCAAILEAAQRRDGGWYLLRGRAAMALFDYAAAGEFLLKAEAAGKACAGLLEICFREQGDFKRAYEYACKQRGK